MKEPILNNKPTVKIFVILVAMLFLACCNNSAIDLKPAVPANQLNDENTQFPDDAADPFGDGGDYNHAVMEKLSDKGPVFLVCGTGGRLDRIYADDTVENMRVPVGAKDLNKVLVSGDTILVGGEQGALAYSLDGVEFRAAKGLDNEGILGLAAFKGNFYACTESGRIFTSHDGAAWKQQRQMTDKPIIGMASNDDCIIAITTDTDIFISEDGEGWSVQNYNDAYFGLAPAQAFSNLINDDFTFILLGQEIEHEDILVPSLLYSHAGGELWATGALTEVNGHSPWELYPLTFITALYHNEELLVLCNEGRLLLMSSCASCNMIVETSQTEYRTMALCGSTLLVAGEGYAYEILDADSLFSDG